MKIFYTGILILLISISIPRANSSKSETVDSSKILYNSTFKLIEKGLLDSALFTIRQAFAFGLPDDSLFYAWAEIYSTKGALDTAIALSLAIKAGLDHPLYSAVLKQRYLLFTLTNQKDRAEAIFDSLNKMPAYRLSYLIPELLIYFKGGVQKNSTKEAEILPYYLDYAYPENEPTRGTGAGGVNLQWKIPLKRSMGIKVSAGANLYQYNPPSPFKIKNVLDSVSSEEHATISYYLLSGMISGAYTLSSYHGYSGDVSIRHNAALDVMTYVNDAFLYGNASYTYDIDGDLHNWNGTFFIDRSWSARRSNSISLSINGVHVKDDTLRTHDTYRKLFTDGKTLYLDSMCTQIVPQSNLVVLARRKVTDTLFTIISKSCITAKINLSQQFSFKHNFSMGTSVGGAVAWFPGYYTWVDSSYSSSDIPKSDELPTLVLDRNGKSYWAIRLFPMLLDSTLKSERKIQRKKRIDQIVTANVNFKKSFKNIVTIGLDGSLSRTFSNMEDYAPVEIPVWSYSVMLSTTFSFNPAGKLR